MLKNSYKYLSSHFRGKPDRNKAFFVGKKGHSFGFNLVQKMEKKGYLQVFHFSSAS